MSKAEQSMSWGERLERLFVEKSSFIVPPTLRERFNEDLSRLIAETQAKIIYILETYPEDSVNEEGQVESRLKEWREIVDPKGTYERYLKALNHEIPISYDEFRTRVILPYGTTIIQVWLEMECRGIKIGSRIKLKSKNKISKEIYIIKAVTKGLRLKLKDRKGMGTNILNCVVVDK